MTAALRQVPMSETRQPPHNLEAERAVLGAVLYSPDAMVRVVDQLGATDFYSPRHQVIWEAAVALHGDGSAIDAVTLEAELKRQGQEQRAGGIAYLVDLGDHCPTAANVEHYARIVAEKASARAAVRAAHDLAASLSADALDLAEALAAARSQLDVIERRGAKPAVPGIILRPLNRAWLREPPPARRWLLRRPTRGGRPCPTWEGDGLLPLGKIGLLVADGGVGKTMALIALAISIATGRPWLDYYVVGEDATGKVLLILAEEDDDEGWRRVYSTAAALQLSEREMELVDQRVVVLATDGINLSLADDFGNPTPDLAGLKSQLEANGPWSCIAADPFGQLVGLEAETNNAVATRTLRSLRPLTTVPGLPTLLLAHHASLDGVNSGRTRARGVTGIRNAARWEATLRAEEKGKGVLFRQSKSNYSIPMVDELRLVRNEGGLLRAEGAEEEQERRQRQEEAKDGTAAEKDAKREAKLAKVQADLLDDLAKLPRLPTTKLQIQAMAKGDRLVRVDAVELLLATRRILPPLVKGEPYRLASLEGTQVELPQTRGKP